MSHEMICPKCRQTFDDEDYCPEDGTRLVSSVASSGPIPEGTNTAAAQPPDDEPTTQRDALGPDSPDTAPESPAEEAPNDQAKPDRLAEFMKRFKFRRPADQDRVGTPDRATPGSPSDETPSPLPEVVLEKGWRIAGSVESRPGLHHWPVEWVKDDVSRLTGHYHRFRTGALTTNALYRRLEDSSTPQLARIWAHGTVDSGGAREDYELVSLPKAGRRLNHWCAAGTPSEHRARHLFPRLLALLEALARAGVQPMAIEPSHIVLTSDNDLWLATAAMLTETSAESFYRPGLEHSALLPQGWSAPELGQENMVTPNAVVFSVGQLLALALWGQPCSLTDLQTGAVAFKSVSDASLARILMGCLWPRSQGRWTVDDLRQAATALGVEAMPATAPWDSLAPGASSTAFSFAGASYWRLELLLADAVQPSHWNEATARIGDILNWADNTAWIGQAKLMRAALEQGRSADWVLVALTRVVRPDIPPTWRVLDLSDDEAARSLAGLAQRALRGADADADVETLRALFEADLRGAFAQLPPQS